jgi:peptide subunit release factor 1 (eRF1)
MAHFTLGDLDPVMDQFSGDGEVVSCYAELTGVDGFRNNWYAVFESQADALRKAVGHAKPARTELENNLTDIKKALESAPPDVNWLGVFSARQRGFLQTYSLDVPVRPEHIISSSPYLVPLLISIHRRREYLVVHVDTRRCQIRAASPGGIRLIIELEEDVPQKQHSAGERWGQSQATIARHRDTVIAHFQKELVDRIEKEWDRHTYSGLMLLGPHMVLEQVRNTLPGRLQARIVGEAPESWYERPAKIAATINEMVLRAFAEDEVKALYGLWDRLAEQRAVATGPIEVLAALQSGRIGPDGHGFLVLGPDPRETVGRCTQCRALAPDAPPTCPRCQAECVVGNLWEEVLLMALRHRIAVHFVAEPDRLAAFGGMVAAFPRI